MKATPIRCLPAPRRSTLRDRHRLNLDLKGVVPSAWGFQGTDGTNFYYSRCVAYDSLHKLLWSGSYNGGALSAIAFDPSLF